jgi:prepilin-type N-terminal cleavage/methylation domain-containing protein
LLRHPRSAGFTTIELLIGVAIVGILAAIAVPTFKSYVYRSRVTEAQLAWSSPVSLRDGRRSAGHGDASQ